MKAFEYSNPTTVAEAVKLLATANKTNDPDEAPRPLAGGQDLLTTMQEYITRPARVVNIKNIRGLDRIEGDARKGLRIGALVTLAEIEENALVRRDFPGLAEAAHEVASPQIRNLGTIGGNLCQRPRCWYYRNENIICLKKGGTECYAAPEDGENKYHAIFGGGPCHIVHPSDLSFMLTALGARLVVQGASGKREIEIEKFFTLPREGNIRRENILKDDELITEIIVPPSAYAKRSTYLKFKERSSLDFAMASVAAAIEMDGGNRIKQARVVLGGVAPVPWRVPKAETFLVGKLPDENTLREAAKIALKGAQPLSKNGYKVPLAQALVRRALAKVSGNSTS
jgi:xanthine dehydrogenase YagS FAD-binding subunit